MPSRTSLKFKLLKLSQDYPEEEKILSENEDGSIFAHIPVRYVKISPPRQISEEQREAASERFNKI